MTICDPHGLWPTRLHCPWDFPGKNPGVGRHFPPGDFPHPRIEPASPESSALAGGFSTTKPPGRPPRRVGLSNGSVQAAVAVHWLLLLCSLWNLPQSGVESMSPALAGGFLSTELPGKSKKHDEFLLPQTCILQLAKPSYISTSLFVDY